MATREVSQKRARIPGRRALLACIVALLLTLSPLTASATMPVYEGEDVTLDLGGYLRALMGLQHIPYDTMGLVPETTGMNSSVLRLEWKANFGESVTLDVHQRLFWQVTSETLSAGAVGIGVSTPPTRTLDLESVLVDEGTNRLAHDIDRLALRLYFDWADLTLGRQAISWGTSNLFTVADIWTAFSPFELDVSEKRGVDAVRAITSVGEDGELDIVIAERGALGQTLRDEGGELEDVSGGARLTAYLGDMDVYVAAAKTWDEFMAFGGISAEVDAFGLRGELAWPAWSLDEEEVGLPRVTAGADYFGDGYMLSGELHYNGAGASDSDDYMTTAQEAPMQRGEVYLLGQAYAGIIAMWEATDLMQLSLTTMGNVLDPSVLVAPTMSYRLSDEADVMMGAYLTFGEEPTLAPVPALGSEFGAYGNFYFVQIAGYL